MHQPIKRESPRIDVRFGISLLAVIGLVAVPASLPASSAPQKSVERNQTCQGNTGSARVLVEGGTFTMGAGAIYREEGPPRQVEVDDFWIDRFEVTNLQFREFVTATGYVSIVEQAPEPALNPGIPAEQLVAGSAVFTPPDQDNPRGSWWTFVEGANWAQPSGPGSTVDLIPDHPVIHISYEDAKAYAKWVGGHLPTEEQWEYAARGGLDGATYAWGETPPKDKPHSGNTWQGIFPVINTKGDGYAGAAPVGCFTPNGYGLHDMTGNVWEWVEAADETPLAGRIKGGSYLCADNFCQRYRPAARHAQEKDFSASHIGFRVAYTSAE